MFRSYTSSQRQYYILIQHVECFLESCHLFGLLIVENETGMHVPISYVTKVAKIESFNVDDFGNTFYLNSCLGKCSQWHGTVFQNDGGPQSCKRWKRPLSCLNQLHSILWLMLI